MDKRLELKNKLHEANESLLRQEYEQAIKLFCDARQLAPGDSKVRLSHYKAVNLKFNQSKKITLSQKMIRILLIARGYFLSSKNVTELFRVYEKLWLLEPLNIKSIEKFVIACRKSRKTKFISLAIQSLIQVNPNDQVLLYKLKDIAIKSSLANDQLDILHKLIKINPDDQDIINEIKETETQCEEIEKKDDPLLHFRNKLKEDPDNISLRMEYIDTQLRSRKFDEAISELENYLNNKASSIPRLEKRLYLAKEHKINFQLAAAQDRNDIELIDQLRNEHDQLRIKQIKLQVDRSPNDLQLRFDYGKVLYDCRKWNESFSQFEHAMHHRQRRIRSLIYRSKILAQLNKKDESNKELEIALAELPNSSREKKEILDLLKN